LHQSYMLPPTLYRPAALFCPFCAVAVPRGRLPGIVLTCFVAQGAMMTLCCPVKTLFQRGTCAQCAQLYCTRDCTARVHGVLGLYCICNRWPFRKLDLAGHRAVVMKGRYWLRTNLLCCTCHAMLGWQPMVSVDQKTSDYYLFDFSVTFAAVTTDVLLQR
jgi:hypothetical protein